MEYLYISAFLRMGWRTLQFMPIEENCNPQVRKRHNSQLAIRITFKCRHTIKFKLRQKKTQLSTSNQKSHLNVDIQSNSNCAILKGRFGVYFVHSDIRYIITLFRCNSYPTKSASYFSTQQKFHLQPFLQKFSLFCYVTTVI